MSCHLPRSIVTIRRRGLSSNASCRTLVRRAYRSGIRRVMFAHHMFRVPQQLGDVPHRHAWSSQQNSGEGVSKSVVTGVLAFNTLAVNYPRSSYFLFSILVLQASYIRFSSSSENGSFCSLRRSAESRVRRFLTSRAGLRGIHSFAKQNSKKAFNGAHVLRSGLRSKIP